MKIQIAAIAIAITSANAFALENHISGGNTHGVFIERGAVFAFGDSTYGVTGPNATATMQMQPVYAGIDNAKSVSSAANWNVVLKNDNSVWWWGWNPNTKSKTSTPTEISELAGVEDVAITNKRIIALSQGRVYVYSFAGAPYEVQGITNATQIDAHENHVLVLTADGSVFSFGENALGQLGNGSTVASWVSASPVLGPDGLPLTNVTKFDAGYDFSAAIVGGEVYSWGKNYSGSLGIGDSATKFSSIAVKSFISDVVDVSATSMSILARKADGSMWGWGWHNYSNGATNNVSAVPVKLVDYVDELGRGQFDSFYVVVDGVRNGWGSAASGSLGTGNQIELHSLAPLLGPTGYSFPEPVVLDKTQPEQCTVQTVEVIKEVPVEVIKTVQVPININTMTVTELTSLKTSIEALLKKPKDTRPGCGYGDDNHTHTKDCDNKHANVVVGLKKK